MGDWLVLNLTKPQERGGRGHPSLLRVLPNRGGGGGPYEILIWLPFSASSGDGRPAPDLLCDLVQVAPVLSASLSFSVKRCNWIDWNLGCLPSVPLGESMILRTRVGAAEG